MRPTGPTHLPRKAARREQSLHLDHAHTLGLQHFQARGPRVRRGGGVQHLRLHGRLQFEAAAVPLRHRRAIQSDPGDARERGETGRQFPREVQLEPVSTRFRSRFLFLFILSIFSFFLFFVFFLLYRWGFLTIFMGGWFICFFLLFSFIFPFSIFFLILFLFSPLRHLSMYFYRGFIGCSPLCLTGSVGSTFSRRYG